MERTNFSNLWQQDFPIEREFTIVCKDGELKVHSLLLTQLPYFVSLFSQNWRERTTCRVELDFDLKVVSTVIETLYSNKWNQNNLLSQLYESIETEQWNDSLDQLKDVVKLADYLSYNNFVVLVEAKNARLTKSHDKRLLKLLFKCCQNSAPILELARCHGVDFIVELTDTLREFVTCFNYLIGYEQKNATKGQIREGAHWKYAIQCSWEILSNKKEDLVKLLTEDLKYVDSNILKAMLSLPHWHEVMATVLYRTRS